MRLRFARPAAAFVAAVLLFGACTGDAGPVPGVSPSASRWRRIADAPPPARQEVAAALVGGRVYIVGGLIEGGSATDAVDVYDPKTNNWSTAPPLPIALHHAMAAEHEGRLFVMGGFGGSLGGAASDRVFVLEEESWREAPSLLRPRAAAGAVSVGGRLVVVGGVSGGKHVGPVEIFDGSSWRDGAPIPSLRDHLSAATDGKMIYAAGGRRAGGHFATFEVYDVATDRWSKLPDMPTARSGNGAAFADGRVVTVGGEGPRIFPEVEAYDVATRRWRHLPDLAVPVHGVGVVSLGSNVYAFVGGSRVGLAPTNACQVLAIA